MDFSKFQKFHEEEQKIIENHQNLVKAVLKEWEPELEQAKAMVKATTEDKVKFLMSTDIGKKLLTIAFSKTPLENLLTKYVEGKETMEGLVAKFEAMAEAYITKQELEIMRQPITSVVPKAVLDYLPKNLVVDIDPDGYIQDLYTRFQNKDKNLGVKVQKQKDFMKIKDKFEKLLEASMASKQHNIKIMSLLISIMYETGIRPGGDDGKSMVRTTPLYPGKLDSKEKSAPDIDPASVTTYGAISLLPSHLHVLDEYSWEGSGVQLTFYGKSGQLNFAEVRGTQATHIIKELLEEYSKKPHGGQLFSIDNGKPVTPEKLTSFYTKLLQSAGMEAEDISGHSLTDLRKLKASTTLHDILLRYQDEFYDKILAIDTMSLLNNHKQSLKELSSVIAKYLEKAVEGAELALNHSSMNMTINSYINPQVILSFLSYGGNIPHSFSELVHDKFQLKFDLRNFVIQATQSKLVDPTGWVEAIGLERLALFEERDEFAQQFSLLRFAKQKKIRLASIIKVIARLQRNIR